MNCPPYDVTVFHSSDDIVLASIPSTLLLKISYLTFDQASIKIK